MRHGNYVATRILLVATDLDRAWPWEDALCTQQARPGSRDKLGPAYDRGGVCDRGVLSR